MRKIVQIAMSQDATDDPALSVLALCDDGTVWRTVMAYGWQKWERLPPVPQEKPRGKEQPHG